jgi:predicted HTH transcriptional regulator
LRNPLIAETMYKSKDIERWGSGIKRIHDECVASGVKVEFKRLKTGFVVVFYRPKWEEGEGLVGGQRGKAGKKGVPKGQIKLSLWQEVFNGIPAFLQGFEAGNI